MKVKYIFSAAGAGKLVKSNLYRLTPVDVTDQSCSGEQHEFYKAKPPFFGTLALMNNKDYGNYLKDFHARNVICPLVLEGNGEKVEISEAIVNVTKTKTIHRTTVVGGKGTVKEFIADADIKLVITIGITATDDGGYVIDEYPGKAIFNLQKILDAKSINAWSPFLELFGIDGGATKIVVENYVVNQATESNRQVVTINAESDYDYTIFAEEN